MSLNLPEPGPQYDRQNEAETRRQMNEADKQNLKRLTDIEMGDARIIMKSPDGTRWAQGVDNAGNTTWTAL